MHSVIVSNNVSANIDFSPVKFTAKSQHLEIGASDKIVASTRVSIPQGDGPITAESVIEAIPETTSHGSSERGAKARRSSNTQKRTFSPTAPTLHEVDDEPLHPSKSKASKPMPEHPSTQLYAPVVKSTNVTPKSGKHSFSSRTFLRSETCAHCQKK